jgi:microcystin-dependent protein
MSEPFVGEIRIFAGNFAPRGYAFCDGQLLAISQNDALFSLLGTIYGGDGRTTFGLPDLRGRIPIHAGTGPGLSARRLGHKGGQESVTLITNQLPSHGHPLKATSATGNTPTPATNEMLATAAGGSQVYFNREDDLESMNSSAISSVGGSRSHTNLQPFLCVHFIIALFGIYPSRH